MKELFTKYRAKLVKEAVWKSIFYGALIGFAVMLAIALPGFEFCAHLFLKTSSDRRFNRSQT